MATEFSRLGQEGVTGTTITNPVMPYGTSFAITMLGNKVVDRDLAKTGKFVGSIILIATIKTTDDKNFYC